MFSNLLFLILTLLIVSLAPEATAGSLATLPLPALGLGLGLYTATLCVIAAQNLAFRRPYGKIRDNLLLAANIELLSFFATYHFILLSHRLYTVAPAPGSFLALGSIVLFFWGLWIFHLTLASPVTPLRDRAAHATTQIRFLLPFCVPFVLFQLAFDALEYAGILATIEPDSAWMLVGLVAFLGLLMIFLPALIQRLWGCEDLPASSLKDRFEALCKRAGFRHAGLKVWTVMNHSLTAAIIGVVPRFRYVMFTESILRQLPPEQLEAILAHEIGHSYRRHLLIYPFVIMGMVVSITLLGTIFGDALFERISLYQLQYTESSWTELLPLLLFALLAVLAALYFRYVFGFFSRLFERQADLHVFHTGVNPEYLSGALHSVAVATGGTHNVPNWHHYSIQQRIDYLHACTSDANLISRHHIRVRRIVRCYLAILLAAIYVLASPQRSTLPGSRFIQEYLNDSSTTVRDWANTDYRQFMADSILNEFNLANEPAISLAFQAGLRNYKVSYIPGVAEFYGAQLLLQLEETAAAAKLLSLAWRRFDFSEADSRVQEDFELVTLRIMEQGADNREARDEINELLHTSSKIKRMPGFP